MIVGSLIFALLFPNGGDASVARNNPLEGAAENPNILLTPRGKDWNYQTDIIRGVNLGGWFVLEPYITPSLFEPWLSAGNDYNVPNDEYHLCQRLGRAQCQQVMNEHWRTWYTEADFVAMREKGINFVRIPVGSWAFRLLKDEPYVQGQQKYITNALLWCRKYGLKVWIDLHGVPGSQNGFDNSGLRGPIGFQQGDNARKTMEILEQVFQLYGHGTFSDVVIGIELINEPLGPALDMNRIKSFYYEGYQKLRMQNLVTPLIIHDAFMPMHYWDNDFKVDRGGYWGVVVDHHHYQVFSGGELQLNIRQHIDVACQWGRDTKTEAHWNVCGEWLAALTDCARWLNGVGRGARWQGELDGVRRIGSCAPYLSIDEFPPEHLINTRKYIEAQLDAFEQTGGWVFWNWKCESADEWDFVRLAQYGLFPQPLTSRQYPNQCGFQ